MRWLCRFIIDHSFSPLFITMELQHYATLGAYCEAINISPPRSEGYDVRSFAENMKTVRQSMPPFKHEFYALALKLEGGGSATTGNHSTADLEATVFFNSPYQILHWDIAPDWEGYYVIFSEDFLRTAQGAPQLAHRFPFLLNDNTYPLPVEQEEVEPLLRVFENLYLEHQHTAAHQNEIIRHYIQILLLQTARLFYKHAPQDYGSTAQRDNDLNTVSRFRGLIETAFYPNQRCRFSTSSSVLCPTTKHSSQPFERFGEAYCRPFRLRPHSAASIGTG